MSPAGVTVRRTIGFARNFLSTALAVGGFLAAAGVAFAFGLKGADGGSLSLPSVWAASVAPFLPVLAALLSMDVWSDERLSGRIDMLLTTPVPERELVVGKFLGVWIITLVAVAASLAASLVLVHANAPSAFGSLGPFDFVPGFFVLSLQGALWCAVSVSVSAFFRHAAASAFVSVMILVTLPRGLWAALAEWSPLGRTAFGDMPLDAHAVDFASGVVSIGPMVAYMVLAAAALFICTKRVEAIRLVGRRAAGSRFSTFFAISLSIVLAVLVTALTFRIDIVAELPIGSYENRISQRMRALLSESHGNIVVTCLLKRNDLHFRHVSHLLRALRQESEAQGGATVTLRFVDPTWDFPEARRLSRLGVDKPSVVLELGRRRAVLPVEDGISERSLASAMLRLTTPPHRSSIYWTAGHGESAFDSYGAFGMSDIARELSRDGFRNSHVDLSGDASIPSDCALIVMAGGREDISRVEAERLGSYLKQGGRLLVLMGSSDGGGLASLLSAWGIRVSTDKSTSSRTLSGGDVVASEFALHPITAPLSGTQVVLEHPVSFVPSSAAGGAGADRIEFTPLVTAGGQCLAAAIERGGTTGEDLAFRPTRIVVVGDSLFAMNGPLVSRGNANRDFILGSVAYLAGTGAMETAGAVSGDVLVTGMDRRAWIAFALQSGLFVPGGIFLALLLYVVSRRRRS